MMRRAFGSEFSQLLFDALAAELQMPEIFDRLCSTAVIQFALFDLNNTMVLCAPKSDENALYQQFSSDGLPIEHNPTVRDKVLELLTDGKITAFLPGELSDQWAVAKAVYVDNVPDSIAVLRYENGISQDDAEGIISMLVRVYGYFNNDLIHENTHQNGFEQSFSKLLLQDSQKSSSLLDVMLTVYQDKTHLLTPNFLQINLRNRDGHIDQNKLRRIGSDISATFPNSYRLIENGDLLVLLYGLREPSHQAEIMEKLRGLIEKHHLRCGISLMFSELENRVYYKRQARIARQIGANIRSAEFLYSADQMLPEILLCGAAELTGSDVLIVHEVLEIAQYDRENQTNYLETLKVYLSYGKRMSATAKALFIDRSTLKYRLEKIRNLIGMDIDDPAAAMILDLSITMYSLQQEMFL